MSKVKIVLICVMMISVIVSVGCSNQTTDNIDDKEFVTRNEDQNTKVYEYNG